MFQAQGREGTHPRELNVVHAATACTVGARKPMGADRARLRSHLQAPRTMPGGAVILKGPEHVSGTAFGIDEERSGTRGFGLGLCAPSPQQQAARATAGPLTAGQGDCQFLMDRGSQKDSVVSDSGPELYMPHIQRPFRGGTSLPSILRLLSLYFRMEINPALGGLFLCRRDCISEPPPFS